MQMSRFVNFHVAAMKAEFLCVAPKPDIIQSHQILSPWYKGFKRETLHREGIRKYLDQRQKHSLPNSDEFYFQVFLVA